MSRKRYPAPRIVTCHEWQASPPRHNNVVVGRPHRIIFHHTAGLAPHVESRDETAMAQAVRYAQVLQHDMIYRRGWNDSGHNFLVMRSGIILQGRWGSVAAIEAGRMVISAHCPGENEQPGIEHEHVNDERLTPAQQGASVMLMAWICDRTGISPTQIYGHSHFYPTECPGSLNSSLRGHRLLVARALTAEGRGKPRRRPRMIVAAQVARRRAG